MIGISIIDLNSTANQLQHPQARDEQYSPQFLQNQY